MPDTRKYIFLHKRTAYLSGPFIFLHIMLNQA